MIWTKQAHTNIQIKANINFGFQMVHIIIISVHPISYYILIYHNRQLLS